ncbi:MAG TPA: M14 family zinc carboxypeptidase [Melioribacteraceae bacterium]|nr:M14 family zinc carboxypeptidase [Melioribacteraceae bacterium]
MKKILLVLLVCVSNIFAQYSANYYLETKGEVFYKFDIKNINTLSELSKTISIDNVKGNTVYAYSNRQEFDKFLKYNLDYEVLKHPGDVGKVQMSENYTELQKGWNTYPTYDAYVQMMYAYQENFPSLCQIIDVGSTVSGRKILFAKLSKNINSKEAEPKVMLSSTIHGDETTGYVLLLRLIDSLLISYNSNSRIKNLLDNCEIWINPNSNPDGTYKAGNSSVSGSTRYNANYVDLNRNFWDPVDGQHPDGYAWQPETILFMNLVRQNIFTMSINFHGGTEVINYPWDTWSRLHPDDAWFQYISHEYADTCQKYAPSNYMNEYNDGITNGYDWYRVAGGKQDFYTFFGKGREVTAEISDTKLLSAALLPAHWEYNKRSLLNFIEQSLFGIKGIVTDELTGLPIKAKIEIQNHDTNADSSFIYSDGDNGFYSKMIAQGNYTIKITAPQYNTKQITGVVVSNRNATNLNIQLTPTNPIPVELVSFTVNKINKGITLNWITATETNNKGFEILRSVNNGLWEILAFIPGKGTSSEINKYNFDDLNITTGIYSYKLKQIDYDGSYKISDVINVDFNSPINFELSQNYPNPFNPITTINYSIPQDNFVTLKVFDVLGKEVYNLVDEFQKSGKYSIKFNAENLTSGVYIYRLKSGDYNSMKKLMLIK